MEKAYSQSKVLKLESGYIAGSGWHKLGDITLVLNESFSLECSVRILSPSLEDRYEQTRET